MKKQILFYLSILCVFGFAKTATSQQYAKEHVLNKPITTSGENVYIARDYIHLQDGFSIKASKDVSFSAMINPFLLFPPTDNIYAKTDGTITTSAEEGGVVGSIPVNFNVSPTGAATYTVPIECPAGVKGMQPNISLVYNSQSGNGIAGWGWNIGGLSMISRVPKNIYHDGQAGGFDWTSSGSFAFDGNRLFEYKDWTDSVEYKCEVETYSVIRGYNIGKAGPEHFKVFTKDGRTLFYGKKGDESANHTIWSGFVTGSGIPTHSLGWRLVKVVDSNGNYVEFTYSSEDEPAENQVVDGKIVTGINSGNIINHRISSIKYGGNVRNNFEHTHEVSFDYENRSDEIVGYISGRKSLQKKRLKAISVKYGDDIISTYSLSYDKDEREKSRLVNVTKSGSNGEHFNPVTFNYGAINKGVTAVNPTFVGETDDDATWFAADITQDGLSDLISIGSEDNETKAIKLYEASSSGGNVTFSYKGKYLSKKLKEDFLRNYVRYPGVLSLHHFHGAKRPGLIIPSYSISEKTKQIHFYFISKDHFKTDPIDDDIDSADGHVWTYNNSEGELKGTTPYTVADFNNDGYDDILYVEQDEGIENHPGRIIWGGYRRFLEEKDVSTSFILNFESEPKHIISGDFNNDGLVDYGVVTDLGVEFYRNKGATKEYEDVLKAEFEHVKRSLIFKSGNSIRFGDFNADGLIDILIRKNSTDKWKIAENVGNWSFEMKETPLSGWMGNNGCHVVDFNADGKSDIIRVKYYNTGNHQLPLSWIDVGWYESGLIENSLSTFTDNAGSSGTLKKFATGDFNGDGQADILSLKGGLLSGTEHEKDAYLY